MKISYGITVCSEIKEVEVLINFLIKNKREQDSIVVLFDLRNGTVNTKRLLEGYTNSIVLISDYFQDNFAEWKNKLARHCTGDYIVQLDADELLNENLVKLLPFILESNPHNDVFLVPRVNTVEGITKHHINKWKWRISKLEVPYLIKSKTISNKSDEYELLKSFNFIIEESTNEVNSGVSFIKYYQPVINKWDYQWRIWKNKPEIRWKNKVHEVLSGYKTFSYLPTQFEYSILHHKSIERQELQNKYYDTL